MVGVFIRRGERHTRRRWLCEHGGRDYPGWKETPVARRSKEAFSSMGFRETMALLAA
jgi:hypothetical protein